MFSMDEERFRSKSMLNSLSKEDALEYATVTPEAVANKLWEVSEDIVSNWEKKNGSKK